MPAGDDPMIAALDVVGRATASVATILQGWAAGLPWQELTNKLNAFRAFRRGADRSDPAAAPVGVAARDEILWHAEGCAYGRARRGDVLPTVSEGLEVPLASGRALAAAVARLDARHCGRPLLPPTVDELPAGVDRGLVCESLGFAARVLEPHRLKEIAAAAAALDPALADFVWHGAGRGLYFAPEQAWPVPVATERAMARTESPDPRRRQQCLAGLVWAATLVNLRHPDLLARMLGAWAGREDDLEPVAHGVAAASAIWLRGTGLREPVDRLASGVGAGVDSGVAKWRAAVAEPCRFAERELVPALATGGIGALFVFRPLTEVGPALQGHG
jgi:hypothetical protein